MCLLNILDEAKKAKGKSGGRWVTIKGRHILIGSKNKQELKNGVLTEEFMSNRYPSIPSEIWDQIGMMKIGKNLAGVGKWSPGRGFVVTANNETTLIHEIGHMAENVISDKVANKWEVISKTELSKGFQDNIPEKRAQSSYKIWENLPTAFSIYHRKISGISITPQETKIMKNKPKTFAFVKKYLSNKQ